jgi:hypothetical protein
VEAGAKAQWKRKRKLSGSGSRSSVEAGAEAQWKHKLVVACVARGDASAEGVDRPLSEDNRKSWLQRDDDRYKNNGELVVGAS